MQTVPTLDLYRELEVDPAATPQTIEAAWRSLVKRHHPDVAADRNTAIEKIKRLNVAHEWLTDRRLREMYDLTQLRRHHAQVTFREASAAAGSGGGAQVGRSPWRIGALTLTPSALASTAVVAILVAAAFGSMAIYGPTGNGALTGGPNGSSIAAPTGSVAKAAATPKLLAVPPYEADLPGECAANGEPVRLDTEVDGRPAVLLFVPCRDGRTAGPLVYTGTEATWKLVTAGRPEKALVAQAGAGSLTGAPNEYWVAWTSGDGVESWLVVYRIEDGEAVGLWSSLDKDAPLPKWELATYRYQTLGGPRGSIEIVSSDPGSGRCRTCPGQLYREVYEWGDEGMHRTYRQPA